MVMRRKKTELKPRTNVPQAVIYVRVSSKEQANMNASATQLDAFVNMLRNPVYIGKIASKYGVSKGLQVGLIPAEVFGDVQATLDGTRKQSNPSQRNGEGFPLRKFLLCTCGTPPVTRPRAAPAKFTAITFAASVMP